MYVCFIPLPVSPPPQEFYEAVKAASKAAVGLEGHYRDVVAPGMEDTPTLRTIASETKKSLLNRVDVSLLSIVTRINILLARAIEHAAYYDYDQL